MASVEVSYDELIFIRDKLYSAIDRKCSDKWCLTLWSRFVRARDAYKCVVCDSPNKVQAHHLFRRTLLPQARFELGNGISLCSKCHKVAHEGFNGRPDMSQPIGAQGGDDQDEIAFYFKKLLESANRRKLDHDQFYVLSDAMLRFFVSIQGFVFLYFAVVEGRISSLTMGYEIWARAPEAMSLAVLNANVPGLKFKEFPEFMVGESLVFYD
ncbi:MULTISPECIES: HNH endonuclease [unclassified Pseudomonas]|uniref:HNH endonuclease n=1 Tax=unclassified Pseudomonas TaxID=196821 RepID=UPI0020109A66|nr:MULTISPECIES: HNH endonuclease [unclassified Pseudomonas]